MIEHAIAVEGHRKEASKPGDICVGQLYLDNATVIIHNSCRLEL